MAAISGDKTNAAVKVASTWGTASAASTGDKYIGLISHALNESVFQQRRSALAHTCPQDLPEATKSRASLLRETLTLIARSARCFLSSWALIPLAPKLLRAKAITSIRSHGTTQGTRSI